MQSSSKVVSTINNTDDNYVFLNWNIDFELKIQLYNNIMYTIQYLFILILSILTLSQLVLVSNPP